MEYGKPKNAAEQQVYDLVKASRHQGAEGARRLIAQMPRIPHKYRKNALGVLSRTQCQEARDYLLSLALSASDTYAAIVYLENSGDSAAARNLLNSTNREIQAIALGGLSGSHGVHRFTLDRRAWDVVKGLLRSESLDVRSAAASVTGRDAGTEVPAVEKAQAVLGALGGSNGCPKPNGAWAGGTPPYCGVPGMSLRV